MLNKIKQKEKKRIGFSIMRINIRVKIKNYTVFFMLSKTQRLKGITSKVVKGKDKHYIFWDLENCTKLRAIQTLKTVQKEFRLGMIFLLSDCPKSYRAFCFSQRTFKEFLHILLHTNYVDWNFIYWTIQRGSATLRTSQKEGREPQLIKAILTGYEKVYIPQDVIKVIYDTGNEKRGIIKSVKV